MTAEEIAAVPLFSTLSAVECERLSRVSADIHLVAGEYAVNEGDERALFAVLDGHIEVVKIIDGVDRVLGHRRAGDIFGEVPLTLGMPFPAGYRAAEASRIMRLEAQDYHTTAATAPDVAVKVGEIARGRIGGLQHIVAEPLPPRAVVVGERWDTSCSDLRQFLDRNQITFEWIRREAEDAEELWGNALPASADCPIVRFADGSTIVIRRCVRSPTGSGSRPSPRPWSTTRSSSVPARPGSPPPSTAPRRGCARS